MAVDSAGNVYVADTDNSTIRRVTAAGAVTTLAGTTGISGSEDGTSAVARFNNPFGVAVDSADNVYVADSFNHTIRKITAAGVVTRGGLLGAIVWLEGCTGRLHSRIHQWCVFTVSQAWRERGILAARSWIAGVALLAVQHGGALDERRGETSS